VLDVAVGEKGMAPMKLTARGRSAHASTPRAGDNALVTAAEAVRRISTARPATTIGEDWRRWVDATVDDEELRSLLLDERTLWDALSRLPDDVAVRAHACTHSTFTPTLVAGGLKNNVVPDGVTVELDVRIVPGESVADVERVVREVLRDLPVTVDVLYRTEPSRSPVTGPIWPALERAVARAHPGGRATPMLFTGATDGRHLRAHGIPVYGFGVLSAALDPATYWSRFHGDDERIDLESLALSTMAWTHVARDFLS
jgi:acetylornithine deacetylase/succinyl-diaminopimelate desuccinylase-like protein